MIWRKRCGGALRRVSNAAAIRLRHYVGGPAIGTPPSRYRGGVSFRMPRVVYNNPTTDNHVISLMPGPVEIADEVSQAFHLPPVSQVDQGGGRPVDCVTAHWW